MATVFDALSIRTQAIQYVLALRDRWYGIPSAELKKFTVDGMRIPLYAQQGIFKPAVLDEPLSIRTALYSPYADPLDGVHVRYAFAPFSREHENDGLKRCRDKGLPLIYLIQTKPKPNTEYTAFAPVFVTSWDNAAREFLIDLSEYSMRPSHDVSMDVIRDVVPLEKRYAPTLVQRRVHQARFRNDVLAAYRERCAVCVLRVRPLLDGAHLRPDREPTPTIIINEGMALCAIHHRAFDAGILRFDAAYRIEVEIPSGVHVGEGEKAMLISYDGKPLTLPQDENHWPHFARL